jgi:hypothetical protein
MNDQFAEVFQQVQNAIADSEIPVERIEIRKATPTEYPCRVYYAGVDDFDGVFVSLADLPGLEA